MPVGAMTTGAFLALAVLGGYAVYRVTGCLLKLVMLAAVAVMLTGVLVR